MEQKSLASWPWGKSALLFCLPCVSAFYARGYKG